MRKNSVTAVLLYVVLAACSVRAQKSDFSILGGAFAPGISAGYRPGSVSAFAGANVQLGYGRQLFRTRNGSVDLDVPLTVAVRHGEVLGRALSVTSAVSTFFTPGVRFRAAPEARLSPFAVFGGGFGAFENSKARIEQGFSIGSELVVSPVIGFGGGADLRLTRWLSLRGQLRDFVGGEGLGGVEGRHHLVVSVGLGFHFR